MAPATSAAPHAPLIGHAAIRKFYEATFRDLEAEKVEPLHRFYGDDHVVDDVRWEGKVVGELLGFAGGGRRITMRVLHVFRFRSGAIVSENAWLDATAIAAQLGGS